MEKPDLKKQELKCSCGHDEASHISKEDARALHNSRRFPAGLCCICNRSCKKYEPVISLAEIRKLWEESLSEAVKEFEKATKAEQEELDIDEMRGIIFDRKLKELGI